jgi:hypothetical protein
MPHPCGLISHSINSRKIDSHPESFGVAYLGFVPWEQRKTRILNQVEAGERQRGTWADLTQKGWSAM